MSFFNVCRRQASPPIAFYFLSKSISPPSFLTGPVARAAADIVFLEDALVVAVAERGPLEVEQGVEVVHIPFFFF